MFLIKTYLDKSPINKVGVFAGESVKKGTLLWEFNPIIDSIITKEQVDQLPELTKKFVIKYAYQKDASNYCLSYDNTSHLNQSSDPNISTLDSGVALRDIQKGEELTLQKKERRLK